MKIYPTNLIFILFFLVSLNLFATEYYVTVNGSKNNNGLTEATSWSIAYAFQKAKAGDIVWIKAGNYGDSRVVVKNPGELNNLIQFIGYVDTPGDISSCYGSTFRYGDTLDPNKMPLLEGVTVSGEGRGTGITINKPYIHIENIQITKYDINLLSKGDNNYIKNIISTQAGNFNPAHTYPSGTSNPLKNYAGYGIIVKGDDSELENSIVINAGAQGISVVSGQNQKHKYNSVYSNSSINPCDYYYLVAVGSNNNHFENVHVERVGSLEHFGHGFVYKVAAQNNHVDGATIVNTIFEHNFSGVRDNLAENVTIIGGSDNQGSFSFRNGAHNNIVKNSKVVNAHAMATFEDSKDDFDSGYDLNEAGSNNTLINVVANNCKYGVNFSSEDKGDGLAYNNTFYNCTFVNMENLCYVEIPNQNNRFINCAFDTIDDLEATIHTEAQYDFAMDPQTFENCNFYDTSFGIPKIIDTYSSELFVQTNAASNESEVNSTQDFNPRRDVALSTSSGEVQNGNYSIKAELTNNKSIPQMYFTHRFDAEVDAFYEISFDAKKTQGRYQRLRNWQGFTDSPRSIQITTSWETYTFIVQATSTQPTMRFYVGSRKNAGIGDDLFIDNFSIKRITFAFAGSNLTDYPSSFVDPQNENFNLLPESELVNIGTNHPHSFDFNNVSRPEGDSYDLGAYEQTSQTFAPSIILSDPCDGTVFRVRDDIILNTLVYDRDDDVSKVEFYSDGTLIATSSGAPFTSTISFQEVGTYLITAQAFDASGNIITSNEINLIIEDRGESPLISLSNPQEGEVFTAGNSITLETEASDPDGTVTLVEFYLNNKLVGSVTEAPFLKNILINNIGDYELYAKAFDNDENYTISEKVNIVVDPKSNPPSVQITNPLDNTLHGTGSQITVEAEPLDTEIPISRVEFYLNDNLVGTTAEAPYIKNIIINNPGNYVLVAKAFDDQEDFSLSEPVNLILEDINTPPEISFVRPLEGSVFEAKVPITLEALASDPDGAIAKVEFYLNDNLVGVETDDPYIKNIVINNVGEYEITAMAYDNEGDATLSERLTIIVEDTNEIPTISLVSPVQNEVFEAKTAIYIEASATDSDGTISKVEFYSNGKLVGTAIGAPFVKNIIINNPGNYAIMAKAFDNVGEFSFSEEIFIVVETPNLLPEISLSSPQNNTVFKAGDSFEFEATAVDPDGSIIKVEFYLDSQLLATETLSPYINRTVVNTVGTYQLVAIAYDDRGASVSSEAANIIIEPQNILPALVFQTPSDGSQFETESSIDILIDASDEDGIISRIELYLDNNLIHTQTEAPFSHTIIAPSPGNYILKAVVFDNDHGSESAEVSLIINEKPNVPPNVSVNLTHENSKSFAGDQIEVQAIATDLDGSISKVEFYMDQVLIATEYNYPYTQTLHFDSPGNYSLFAIAYDDDSDFTTSNSVEIIIEEIPNEAPIVEIENPQFTSTYNIGDEIEFNALATDKDGTISKVEFYINNTLFSTIDEGPFNISVTMQTPGNYTIHAIAYDDKDSSNISNSLDIVIVEPINQAPLVTIELLEDFTLINAGDTLRVNAFANDLDGTISRVELFINNTFIEKLDTAPYSWEFPIYDSGIFEIKAIAYDNDNEPAQSNILTVTSVENTDATQESGLSQLDLITLKLYPNPTSNYVYIKGDVENTSLVLIDLLGRVTPINGRLVNSNELEIDLTRYPKGIYIIKITDENNSSVTKKVIKK